MTLFEEMKLQSEKDKREALKAERERRSKLCKQLGERLYKIFKLDSIESYDKLFSLLEKEMRKGAASEFKVSSEPAVQSGFEDKAEPLQYAQM